MIEDPAKFPRAKAAVPPMSVLDRQIEDAKHRMVFAKTDDLRCYYAERAVGLQFERGDFPMIQSLDVDTRRGLVNAMIKQQQEPVL